MNFIKLSLFSIFCCYPFAKSLAEIQHRYLYCADKKNLYWNWVQKKHTQNQTEDPYIKVFGKPAIISCFGNDYVGVFVISVDDYKIVKETCGDNHYAQPAINARSNWYVFATKQPNGVIRVEDGVSRCSGISGIEIRAE